MAIMMLAAALLLVNVPSLVASEAWAQGGAPTNSVGTPPAKCKNYAGLTNKVVNCIRATVDAGAAKFFTGFYPLVRNAIGAVMTLAVIVYGILLAYGMVEKVGRDTMILLFKLSGVVYFTMNSPLMYDMAKTMMDKAALAAVSYTPPSGRADMAGSNYTQAVCLQNMLEMQQKATGDDIIGPWLGVDCIIDSVVGIRLSEAQQQKMESEGNIAGQIYFNKVLDVAENKDGAKQKLENDGMSRSLIYLFFSGMQTSTVGFILALIGGIFLWGLLILIIKTIFIYLAGYLGVAFTIIISPLIIPLILFRETRQYFDKWTKTVISFAIQPIIMMVFITFSLAAIDFAAFSGNYSIWYRIAGEETRQESFDLNYYLTVPRKADGTIAGPDVPESDRMSIVKHGLKEVASVRTQVDTLDEDKFKVAKQVDDSGVIPEMVQVDCSSPESRKKMQQEPDGPLKKYCVNKYKVGVWLNTVNWDLMAKARKDPAVVVPPCTNTGSGTGGTTTGGTTGCTQKTLGQVIANEVIASTLFCAMVVFLMNGILRIVPMVAHDITGDFNQSVNLGAIVQNKAGESTVGGALGGAAQNMMSSAKSMLGGATKK